MIQKLAHLLGPIYLLSTSLLEGEREGVSLFRTGLITFLLLLKILNSPLYPSKNVLSFFGGRRVGVVGIFLIIFNFLILH